MEQPFDKELELAQPFQDTLQLVPSWEKQIQLLGHLCQFSQNILVMLGEHSSGKSSFASLLSDYKIPGIHKILLRGKNINSPEQLMDEISKNYDNSNQAYNFSGSNQPVGNDDLYGPTWTVLVDDADSLSVDTLRALLRLVDNKLPTKQQLHIILLADLGFEEVMQSEEIYEIIEDKVHPIELDSWHEEDVEYLLEKQDKAVADSFILTLLEQTQGRPKAVIDSVAQVQSFPEPSPPAFNYEFISRFNNPITYGVSLGLFVGFAFLIFSVGDNNVPSQSPVNIAIVEHEKEKFESSDTPKVDLVFKDDIQTEKPAPTVRKDSVPVLGNESSDQSFETLELVRQSKKEPSQVTQLPKSLQSTVEVASPAKVEPKQSLAKKQVSKPKQAIFHFTDDEQAVLAQQGNSFTLQLVGSSKSPNMEQFLKENRLNSKGKLIRTTRSGKDWYVILYGSYSSYELAKKAAADIADSSKITPWVRSYKSIHSDIERLAKTKNGFAKLSDDEGTQTTTG